MAEDAAALLADFVSSLDNLPSEVQHILQEIGHKEARTNDIKNKALSRDQAIQKHARPVASGGQGLLEPNPKEDELIKKIRLDLDKAETTAKEKVALSERGVKLISRHLNRLQSQLELVTSAIPPLPTLPSFDPVMPILPTPIPVSQPPNPNLNANQASPNNFGAYNHPGTPAGVNYALQNPNPAQRKPGVTAQAGNIGTPGQPSPIQIPMLQGQLQQHLAAHSPQGQYAFATGAGIATGASASAGAGAGAGQQGTPMGGAGRGGQIINRPGTGSRLPGQYPSQPGGTPLAGNSNPLLHLQQTLGGGATGAANLAMLQQQQQQQQHAHLQQQQHQMRIQQQAHAMQQQQLANQQQLQQQHGANAANNKRKRQDEEVEAAEGEAEGEDLTPYCFCHRPSFGEMIGCDAPNCQIEWFHLSCVGLKSTPEGSWYCRDCEPKMQKGASRKRR